MPGAVLCEVDLDVVVVGTFVGDFDELDDVVEGGVEVEVGARHVCALGKGHAIGAPGDGEHVAACAGCHHLAVHNPGGEDVVELAHLRSFGFRRLLSGGGF